MKTATMNIGRVSLPFLLCLIVFSTVRAKTPAGSHLRVVSPLQGPPLSNKSASASAGGALEDTNDDLQDRSVIRGGDKGLDLTKAQVPKGKVSVGRMLEFHKILWLPVSLYMMWKADNDSLRSVLLTGLFGGYGIIWVIKSYTFWDKKFYNEPSSFLSPISLFFANISVGLYLLLPYAASKNTAPLTDIEIICATTLFTIGVFFHYAADSQKFFSLKYCAGLVTDGLFTRCRNPSYFGEWLIWISFTLIAGYDKPLLLIPNLWFAFVTIASAFQKDQSLSRYPEFGEWKKKTWLLVPKPW